MKRKMTILLVLATLGLSAGSAMAAFDSISVSPRARAMGESGVAVPDDAYAAFINPGQLAQTSGGALAASYVRPFSLSYADNFFLGAALPISPEAGAFGLSFSKFKVDYQDVRLLDESQIGLAYGRNLYSDYHSSIDLGASVNMYHMKAGQSVSGIDPGNDTALGIDLGMVMVLHKRTRLAFMVKNLNNPNIGIDEEELARRLSAGISYEPYAGVITTFEFDNELGQDVQYHGGAEMTIFEGFALRAGVITNPSKLTAGFGYTMERVSLNYGFSTGGGTLESTHQFGLNFTWGGEAQ